MLKRLLIVVIVLTLVPGGVTSCRCKPSITDVLNGISAWVVETRGLAQLSEVEPQFITSSELRARLLEDFDEDYPEEEAAIDQEVLVLLDLMEEGQDLRTILLDLYSEQVIGLYDPETKELYVISDQEGLSISEKVTFAHEYTHALQDQHFDLEALKEQTEDDSEFSAAVTALIEGDAVLTEAFYFWNVLSDSEREAYFQEFEGVSTEKFEAAPRIIQEHLLFPYVAGPEFVASLYLRGGWEAINDAFSDPPKSTEQIIHPEKYYLEERDNPQEVTMPDLKSALGDGWSQLNSDVIGELDLRIYLETFVDPILYPDVATTAAAGWGGDRYVFLKDGEGRKLLVLYSTWDSDEDAQEFFDAYITFVENKSEGTWTLLPDEVGIRQWETDGLSLYLGLEGSDVLIIIAPDETTTDKVLAAFPT